MFKSKMFYTLSMSLICTLFFFSCNTNKNTSETKSPSESSTPEANTTGKNILNVQLEESLTGKYISKTYGKYSPTDMSSSNRTLNQYVVNFNCSANEFSNLKELLDADPNVEIMKTSNQKDIQSSKSTKHSKTKSIRNNN